MLDEKDLILRTIQQLAKFAAALLRRALGLAEQGHHEEALRELENGQRELFGIDARILPLMDADTLLRALGHSEKARLFVEVLLLEARLREESGDPLRGQQLRDKAANLLARIETPRA